MIGCVRCPKCSGDVPDSDRECPHCGIVFSKYRDWAEPLPLDAPERVVVVDGDRPGLPAAIARGLFLALLTIWTMTQASRVVNVEGSGSVMHLPNLVFHEAGHVLFLPLGRFMTVLGGSLTQVLVPLVCAGAFLWQTRDAFGAAIAIWWAGQSLTDVATYINDARALQLVLLGGQTGAEVEGHDWEYLLNAMGVSHHDHAIALVVHTIGTVLMIAALVWAATFVFNQVSSLRSRPAD